MKILLVSDTSHFSTRHVYEGYEWALKQLNIPFETADLSELKRYYAEEIAVSLVMTKALIKDNGFTHIVFVCGLSIPSWMYASMYDKKVCVISTEDPHATKALLGNKKYIEYYFTNERTLEDKESGIYYLPLATTKLEISKSYDDLPDAYKQDVCFIGTIYPNRAKILERVAAWCIQNDKTCAFYGGYSKKTERSPLIDKFLKLGTVDNKVSRAIYFGSKVNLNLDRDVRYHATYDTNELLLDVGKEPETCNPRSYEVALSRGLQMFVEPRKEAVEVFGDSALYAKEDNIEECLNGVFDFNEETRNWILKKAYDKVMNGHLYIHRVVELVNILEGE